MTAATAYRATCNGRPIPQGYTTDAMCGSRPCGSARRRRSRTYQPMGRAVADRRGHAVVDRRQPLDLSRPEAGEQQLAHAGVMRPLRLSQAPNAERRQVDDEAAPVAA